jgi:hypothetical protein
MANAAAGLQNWSCKHISTMRLTFYTVADPFVAKPRAIHAGACSASNLAAAARPLLYAKLC